jgi:hypothetical protein
VQKARSGGAFARAALGTRKGTENVLVAPCAERAEIPQPSVENFVDYFPNSGWKALISPLANPHSLLICRASLYLSMRFAR